MLMPHFSYFILNYVNVKFVRYWRMSPYIKQGYKCIVSFCLWTFYVRTLLDKIKKEIHKFQRDVIWKSCLFSSGNLVWGFGRHFVELEIHVYTMYIILILYYKFISSTFESQLIKRTMKSTNTCMTCACDGYVHFAYADSQLIHVFKLQLHVQLNHFILKLGLLSKLWVSGQFKSIRQLKTRDSMISWNYIYRKAVSCSEIYI